MHHYCKEMLSTRKKMMKKENYKKKTQPEITLRRTKKFRRHLLFHYLVWDFIIGLIKNCGVGKFIWITLVFLFSVAFKLSFQMLWIIHSSNSSKLCKFTWSTSYYSNFNVFWGINKQVYMINRIFQILTLKTTNFV